VITGDAISKQGKESDFTESDDLPEVPSNIREYISLVVHMGTQYTY